MRTKIVNIMPFCPPYDLYWNDPRPSINWDLPNGQWVGIWGYDWLNLIGTEVLKLTDEFVFEIWQPDARADKVYSHTFPDGLVHRLFPATLRKRMYGLKTVKFPCSNSMISYLVQEIRSRNTIFRVMGMDKGMARDILKTPIRFPTIAQFWGEFKSPLRNLQRPQKNIPAKLFDIREHFILRKLFRKVDYFTCSDEHSRKNIMKYTRNDVISLSIGIDFDFWRLSEKKSAVRRRLGLNGRPNVFISSARLVDAKQVDKVIAILNKLDKAYDFLYIVTGHGDQAYDRYLKKLGAGLLRKGKLKFTGYVGEQVLFDYYSIADLFIMSSLSEAGPTATIQAIAMEVPVLTTQTGQMAEVLHKHGSGVVVPVRGYGFWERELREILNGKMVRVLDREIVKKIHHWPYVAQQYIDLYRTLIREYYDR